MSGKWVVRKAPANGVNSPKILRVTARGESAGSMPSLATPSSASTASAASPASASPPAASASPAVSPGKVRTLKPKIIRKSGGTPHAGRRRSREADILPARDPTGSEAKPALRVRRATINMGAMAPNWLQEAEAAAKESQAASEAKEAAEASRAPTILASSATRLSATERRKLARRSLLINKSQIVAPGNSFDTRPASPTVVRSRPRLVVGEARASQPTLKAPEQPRKGNPLADTVDSSEKEATVAQKPPEISVESSETAEKETTDDKKKNLTRTPSKLGSWLVHGLGMTEKRSSRSKSPSGRQSGDVAKKLEETEAEQAGGQDTTSATSSPPAKPLTSPTLAPASDPPEPAEKIDGSDGATATSSESKTEDEKAAAQQAEELEAARKEHTGETNEQKRREVLDELLQTEQSYLADLLIIMNVILEPLRKQNLLTKQQTSSLFANVEAIIPVNTGMLAALRDLQAGKSESSLGEIFVERSVLFKLYAVYCSNQPNIRDRILDLKREVPEFADFLKKQLRKPECRRLDLEAFLIMPLQRLCKYPLLLKELLKHTSGDHREFPALKQAKDEISEIVTKVNERVRQVENLNKLISIAKEIDTSNSDVDVVVHNRTFLFESSLVVSKRPAYGYLFNDGLLVCKIKKKKEEDVREARKLTPLADLTITDLEDEDGAELKFRFEVADKSKSEVYQAPSRLKKKHWLKHLKSAIDTAVEEEAAKARAMQELGGDKAAAKAAKPLSEPPKGSKISSRVAAVKEEGSKEKSSTPPMARQGSQPLMIDPRIKKMSSAEKDRRIVELERTLEAFKVRCIEMKGLLKNEKLLRINAESRATHLQEVLSSPSPGADARRRGDTVLDEKMPLSRSRSSVVVEASPNERLDTLNKMMDGVTEENFKLRQKLKAAKEYITRLEADLEAQAACVRADSRAAEQSAAAAVAAAGPPPSTLVAPQEEAPALPSEAAD